MYLIRSYIILSGIIGYPVEPYIFLGWRKRPPAVRKNLYYQISGLMWCYPVRTDIRFNPTYGVSGLPLCERICIIRHSVLSDIRFNPTYF